MSLAHAAAEGRCEELIRERDDLLAAEADHRDALADVKVQLEAEHAALQAAESAHASAMSATKSAHLDALSRADMERATAISVAREQAMAATAQVEQLRARCAAASETALATDTELAALREALDARGISLQRVMDELASALAAKVNAAFNLAGAGAWLEHLCTFCRGQAVGHYHKGHSLP